MCRSGLCVYDLAPSAIGHVVAAGHNKRLLPAAVFYLQVWAASLVAAHPLYSLRSSGMLIRVSAAGWAAAEAQAVMRTRKTCDFFGVNCC